MAETSEIKIQWLKDFYGWEKIEGDTVLTTEDFVKINQDVQLLKFNPKTATKSLWKARNIQLFQTQDFGFTLYQCDAPSDIRKGIPLRFFYCNKYGKAFILDGTNTPFYDLFKFINTSGIGNGTKISSSDWIKDSKKVITYSRLFFDNVAGRWGRFEIIEPYLLSNDKISDSYELLLNRIETYHERMRRTSPEGAEVQQEVKEKNFEFHKNLKRYFERKYGEDHKVNVSVEEETAVWKDCHMLFKDSLFTAQIIVESSANISMDEEKILSHYDILEETEQKKKNDLEAKKLKEEKTLYALSESNKKKLGVNSAN